MTRMCTCSRAAALTPSPEPGGMFFVLEWYHPCEIITFGARDFAFVLILRGFGRWPPSFARFQEMLAQCDFQYATVPPDVESSFTAMVGTADDLPLVLHAEAPEAAMLVAKVLHSDPSM